MDSGPTARTASTPAASRSGQAGAVTGTTRHRGEFDGSDGRSVGLSGAVSNPTVYSEELWFKTTHHAAAASSSASAANQAGAASSYDRHVYMVTDGRLIFGVWTGQTNTDHLAAAYNDGAWHHVVATQGADGMTLYVDGALVGTQPADRRRRPTPATGGSAATPRGAAPAPLQRHDRRGRGLLERADRRRRSHAHYDARRRLAANQAPTAAFTARRPGSTASFDGSAPPTPTARRLLRLGLR